MDSLAAFAESQTRELHVPLGLKGLDLSKSAVTIGAPLAGKTSALRHIVMQLEAQGAAPSEILVLTPSRMAAAILRDQIALDSDQSSESPRARSVSSAAFEILSARGPIRLLSGAHQQTLLQRLVSDRLTPTKASEWNVSVESLELEGFVQELRDLLAVIIESGLSQKQLEELQAEFPKLRLRPAIELLGPYREHLGLEGLVDSSQLPVAAAAENLSELPHRFLLVDDAHNLSAGQLRLVQALASDRVLFVFGDPDVATLGFRNSSSAQFLELAKSRDAVQISLEPEGSASCAKNLLSALSSRIPASGPVSHRPRPNATADSVLAMRFDNLVAESDFLAAELRRSRLTKHIDWSEMLVVGRTRVQLEQLSRELSSRGVPVRIQGVQRPLRDQSMARALLLFMRLALEGLDGKSILELIGSPLVGLDSLAQRRALRQLANIEELSALSRNEKLEKVFDGEFEAEELPTRLQQLKDAVSAVRQLSDPGAHQVVSIGFSLADTRLAELSRGSGATALAANRSLDAALELFAASQRWDERELGSPLSFAQLQLELGVPEDSLAPIGTKPAVVLATPAQISRSYKLVSMARLQEGIWPNLTPRNSLLGAASLQAFLVGRQESPQTPARSELADELRMFYRACGSATEQLLLSAIEDETEQPSQFFQMAKLEPTLNRESIDFDLRRVVGRLRRRLYHGDESAAATLSAMALAGLPGAHPENWQGLMPLSREDGIAGGEIRVSASKFESFEQCPLHWFISSFGGDQGGFQASVGTLLHAALEAASSGVNPADFVDRSWHTIEFESEWLANKSCREAAQMAGLISEYLTSSAELVAAEKGFRVTIGSLQVSGRIDRIERSELGIEAVDLKTGKKMPSQSEMARHRQLAIYQLAIESAYNETPAGGRLVSVGSNKVKTLAQPALSRELRDELTEIAGAIQGQLESGLFTARLDEHCEKNGSCQLLIGRVITGG